MVYLLGSTSGDTHISGDEHNTDSLSLQTSQDSDLVDRCQLATCPLEEDL